MNITLVKALVILAVVAGVITTVAGFADWDHFWGWAALTATLYLCSRAAA